MNAHVTSVDTRFVTTCDVCDGKGTLVAKYPDGRMAEEKPCRPCFGLGLQLTAEGEEYAGLVMFLIRRERAWHERVNPADAF